MYKKRTLFILVSVFFVLGVFFGSGIGYIVGGNDGAKQITEKIQNDKIYETCVSKSEVEVDTDLFPVLPLLEKTKKNLDYSGFNSFSNLESIKQNKEFKPNTKTIYTITTQYENEYGTVIQSNYTVDKETYDSIIEGDSVYFDKNNNVEIYNK